MDNVDTPETTPQPQTAGRLLLEARKEAGLTRADIASRTKVAERHILAIEEDRFEDLAARTYAVGFSRAYARALGLDETLVAEKVRNQLDAQEPHTPSYQPAFEPGDPARVPSSGLAWMAAGAVVLIFGIVVYFWSSVFSPEGELPSLLAKDEPTGAPVAAPAPVTASAPASAASGPVVLTANADQVWLRVSDADGKTLVEKVLSRGETWTVPSDAQDPQLRTARPDALGISVGGTAVPPLSDKPETVSNVSLKPGDLVKRAGTAGAAAAARTIPAATSSARSAPTPASPTPSPSATQRTPAARTTTSPSATPTRAPRTSTPRTQTSPRSTASAPATTTTARPSPRTTSSATSTGAPENLLPEPATRPAPAPVSTTSE